MKKLAAIFLVFIMVLGFAACSQAPSESNSLENSTTAKSDSNTVATKNESSDSEDSTTQPNTESGTNSSTTAKPTESKSPKILVAYFSATGTTEGVAKTAAEVMDADLYEIVPADPYTAADLNYNDNNSRSTKEMNDPNARPQISGSVSDMSQYDIVFVGYPIWWGDAPRIMSTFMESYNFSGKTVVPFCTSGGSGVGSSALNLEKLTSGATFTAGQRLNGGDSRSTIISWINGLGLNIPVK